MTRATVVTPLASGGFDEGDKMRRWQRNLSNPQAALKQIGALMVAESQGAFKKQQFGTDKWPARSVPSVFGILADFHAGKRQPPARRFEARPALRDTGRLASSIAFRVSGSSVEVDTNVPYADAHQYGGAVTSKPITKTVQSLLGKWLAKKGAEWRKFLGKYLRPSWLGKTDTMEVPERPFVGITKQTVEDIQQAVGVHIMEVR